MRDKQALLMKINPRRRLLVVVLLLYCLAAIGQPDFNRLAGWKTNNSTPYIYKSLNIKDTQSVVITISYVGLWTDGQYLKHFVINSRGRVKEYKEFLPRNEKVPGELNWHQFNEACEDSLFKVLNGFIEKDLLNFDQDSLSFIPKPIKTDSSITMIPTADGLHYSISLIKGRKFLLYNTFSPETLIESKSPGYREKERFLEVYHALKKVAKCEDG